MIKPKRSKFRNKKTVIDGITFDSTSEGKRYIELKTLEQIGIITELKLQQKFKIAEPCIINGRKRSARYYIADFVYMQDGKQVIEDHKGMLTDMYKFKRHLMKSVLGLDILETF